MNLREEAPGLGNLESDFDFCQAPRPPLLLPVEPAPGPASCPPGSVPPALQSPCLTPAGPAPASPTAPPASVPPLILQLTASVAPRQDLRINHGRIYLMVGCNMACSIYAHGHLNLTRGRRHLGLRLVRTSLTAHRTVGIALSLSRRNLSAVRRALSGHRSVKASTVGIIIPCCGEPVGMILRTISSILRQDDQGSAGQCGRSVQQS